MGSQCTWTQGPHLASLVSGYCSSKWDRREAASSSARWTEHQSCRQALLQHWTETDRNPTRWLLERVHRQQCSRPQKQCGHFGIVAGKHRWVGKPGARGNKSSTQRWREPELFLAFVLEAADHPFCTRPGRDVGHGPK